MKTAINFFLTLFFLHHTLLPVHVTLMQTDHAPQEKELTLTFHLDPDEKILKQTIKISSDSPDVSVTTPQFLQPATKQFLPAFKDSKELFNQDFSLTTTAQCATENPLATKLYLHYLAIPQATMTQQTFELAWNQPETAEQQQKMLAKHTPAYTQQPPKKSYFQGLQHWIQTTQNFWIRLLLIFLLGLLLSLTPCIYPMIPITIGILHRNQKSSLAYNFAGSLCYAFGLSTTFAIMGLLASLAGASFGNLVAQPLVVMVITLFIGYMSLSMIGLVNMPTPSFFKNNNSTLSSFGPFLSAFLFGLASGTIASPCLSPGLALVLTMVATMRNIFKGFWLLFVFGIGMSIPLVILGTFSSSLALMPRAGQWMVEIKKGLGFIMLATCFFYLSNVFPPYWVMLLGIVYLLFAGLFYIVDAQKTTNTQSKTIKSLLGIVLLGGATFMAYRMRNIDHATTQEQGVTWAENYQEGLQQALDEHKLLLLDFWANHCTICKAIEKKLFHKKIVAQALEPEIVFVKIDCSSSHNTQASDLKHQFAIVGQPAILLVDPTNQTVLKRWSSEPYNMTPEEFVAQIKAIITK